MKQEICMLAMAGDETKLNEMIASGNYAFERKWDGERCIIEVQKPDVRLLNRRGKLINSQFPELVEMGRQLPDGTYDGEIYIEANAVSKDKPTTAGRTNVNPKDAQILGKLKPATFKCWDVLKVGKDFITHEPYEARKSALSDVDRLGIKGFEAIYPEEDVKDAWDVIVKGGDEGMVAKRVGSPYEFARSSNWMKLKTWQEEDFQVIGITSEKREVSALVLEGGLKVNCSMEASDYNRLVADLIRTEEIVRCQDGTVGTRIAKPYTAKIKFLSKTETGLRFPILRELV